MDVRFDEITFTKYQAGERVEMTISAESTATEVLDLFLRFMVAGGYSYYSVRDCIYDKVDEYKHEEEIEEKVI